MKYEGIDIPKEMYGKVLLVNIGSKPEEYTWHEYYDYLQGHKDMWEAMGVREVDLGDENNPSENENL